MTNFSLAGTSCRTRSNASSRRPNRSPPQATPSLSWSRPRPAGLAGLAGLAGRVARTPPTLIRSTGEIPDPNGIMNDQFMSVLKESLSRQGEEALTAGPEADEFRKSATVEMLEGALSQSVNSLRVMNAWKQQIDAQVVAQEKQVQRLHFALTKAKNDAAYMQSMKKMMFEVSD
jgi:hypothetical protein